MYIEYIYIYMGTVQTEKSKSDDGRRCACVTVKTKFVCGQLAVYNHNTHIYIDIHITQYDSGTTGLRFYVRFRRRRNVIIIIFVRIQFPSDLDRRSPACMGGEGAPINTSMVNLCWFLEYFQIVYPLIMTIFSNTCIFFSPEIQGVLSVDAHHFIFINLNYRLFLWISWKLIFFWKLYT